MLLALAWIFPIRWDMTDDHRYSLNPATKALLRQAGKVHITSYLTGDLNSGFQRLSDELEATAREFHADYKTATVEGKAAQELQPILLHERTINGRSQQMEIYPYVDVTIGGKNLTIKLLHNQRGLSGEENINRSIEDLEYKLAEAVYTLTRDSANSHPVRIVTGADVASGEQRFEVDQFIMNGGRVLWALDGVQADRTMLAREGVSPVLAANESASEMLYHYGVRVEAGWIEDRQCMQYPYYFAPLLLTSQQSPITRNLGQTSTILTSPISVVGGEDGITKTILLASSTASRVRRAPGEIRLQDEDESTFRYAYVPAALALEGEFKSAFRHLGTKRDTSLPTRQIVVGTSSILQESLPGMNNEEFLQNALAWLADEDGLLELRNKVVQLRLLNDSRSHAHRQTIMTTAIALPIVLLAMVALISILTYKRRYTR